MSSETPASPITEPPSGGSPAAGTPEAAVAALLSRDPSAMADPYPLYALLREQVPVFDAGGLWLVSRYEDVFTIARNRAMSFAQPVTSHPLFHQSLTLRTFSKIMLFTDPPTHTRLRQLVQRAFTRKTVARLTDFVEAVVDDTVDRCREKGTFDLVAEFADPLPLSVICHMLGVPPEDEPRFRGWVRAVITGNFATLEALSEADAAMQGLLDYMHGLLSERRSQPGEDLISQLISARDEGDQLSDEESVAMAILLLLAGSDTTSHLLSVGAYALLKHPDQLERLRQEPDLVENAVEELLRYDGPVHTSTVRTAAADLELSGVTIPQGAAIMPVLAAANRDPAAFERPDDLDVARTNNRHLAFSTGTHTCRGTMLARLEGAIGIRALATRFDRIELEEDPIPWITIGNIRGIERLAVSVAS